MSSMAARNIPLAQLYPDGGGAIALNVCGDPDCSNFGVKPDFCRDRASQGLQTNTPATGSGHYALSGASKEKNDKRRTFVNGLIDEPLHWSDQRTVRCQQDRNGHKCGDGFTVLSDRHLADEIDRLVSQNGVLDGPRCGACGQRYLSAPQEFMLNGMNRRADGPPSVRIVHRPCNGKKGARFTVGLAHGRQRKSSDNIRIARSIMNSAGVLDIRRIIDGIDPETRCGISRIYDRISWLEEVMLAYEQAQLAKWRARLTKDGAPARIRVSHDDIVLGVNWQTDRDRRVTPLNCSISADADSGYVYRADVDFDPRQEPLDLFQQLYHDDSGLLKDIGCEYRKADGTPFTVPLFHFQRPSGRLDERAFFGACLSRIEAFRETKLKRIIEQSPGDRRAIRADLDQMSSIIGTLAQDWFGFPDLMTSYRPSFSGATVRQVYTKAAHFAALRDMLPATGIVIMTEQEGAIARTLPHVFRTEIKDDRFTWLVVSFDKAAKKPQIEARTRMFARALTAHRDAMAVQRGSAVAYDEACLDYIDLHMTTVTGGTASKPAQWPQTYLQRSAYPKVWVRSPIQSSGETNKIVGMPIVRRDMRKRLKRLRFDAQIMDHDLRKFVGEEIWRATLQPASTFMNSLRERLSPAARAGAGGARSGGAYIQGALFNPRVLIALINIFRVHYNFFEMRPYVAPWSAEQELGRASRTRIKAQVPGTGQVVELTKRRSRTPRRLTPAMRHGIHLMVGDDARAPELAKMLYRPWLFAGTPLWTKFEARGIDLRRSTPVADARKLRSNSAKTHLERTGSQ